MKGRKILAEPETAATAVPGGAAGLKSVRKARTTTKAESLPEATGTPKRATGRIRERNRAVILKAAEAVFAKHGFGGTTTAEIAKRARLPKANLHYYFGTKRKLYDSVIENILDLWLGALDDLQADAEPAQAIASYIRKKIEHSRDWPAASRVYAMEVLNGGGHIDGFMRGRLRDLVREKGKVLDAWVRAGKMAPVQPEYFFFMLWAVTQHYADFAPQVAAVLGQRKLDDAVFDEAARFLTDMVLRGCAIEKPADVVLTKVR